MVSQIWCGVLFFETQVLIFFCVEATVRKKFRYGIKKVFFYNCLHPFSETDKSKKILSLLGMPFEVIVLSSLHTAPTNGNILQLTPTNTNSRVSVRVQHVQSDRVGSGKVGECLTNVEPFPTNSNILTAHYLDN